MWNEEENVIVVEKEEKLYVHKLSDLEELQGVFAYKLEVYYAGKVLSTTEGLTNEAVIDKFATTGVFRNTFGYELVVVDLMGKALQDQKVRNLPDDCYIFNPFTKNIKIDKDHTYALIKDKIGYDGTVDDYLGKYHAIGVHMDYINGHITEADYDLAELLTILKNRDDVVFLIEAKIEMIPYYNADEDRNETINFIWYPKEEDYKKCVVNNHFKVDLAPTKVFGVERKEYEY